MKIKTLASQFYKLPAFFIFSCLIIFSVACVVSADTTTGLVGHWKFDENSGTTAFDSTSNGNNGTVNGATWTTGVSGSAMRFNGSGNYVFKSNPSSVLKPSNQVSVSAWVKTNSTDSDGEDIVSMGDSYAIRVNPDGNVVFLYHNNTNWEILISTSVNILDNQWHLITGQKTSTSEEIYVDGVLKGSTDVGADTIVYNWPAKTYYWSPGVATEEDGSGSDLRIGKHGHDHEASDIGGHFDFNGSIDDARIYNRALTAQEIMSIYRGNLASPQNIGAEALCTPAVNVFWKAPNAQVQSYNIENVGVWGPKNTTATGYADNAVSKDRYYIYDVTAVYPQGESEAASIFIKTPSEDECEKSNKNKGQSCPYSSDVANNKYALDFNTTLWGAKPIGPTIPINMPAGRYKVSLASFDGYPNRAGPQPYETWYISLKNSSGSEIAKTSPSTDLKDYVEYVYKKEVVDESLEINGCVASAQSLSWGINSVLGICGYFEKLDGPGNSCQLNQPLSEPLGSSSSQSSANAITSVNCQASPQVANIGQDVVWTVAPIPPSDSYTYSWSGDDNLSGSSQSVTKSYSTVGTKTGRVDIGGAGNPQQCTATVKVMVNPYFDEF